MSDLSTHLDALRGVKVAPAAAAFSIESLRADFKLVWGFWIECIEETPEAGREAGRWVQEHMSDRSLMDGVAAHYRQMADWIRECNARDPERAIRIRNEVRAARPERRKGARH